MGQMSKATTQMRTINGERVYMRHRTPGTTDGNSRRRNKSDIKPKEPKEDSHRDSNTIMDIRREGVSEYNTTARTGSQGQGTVKSLKARMNIINKQNLGSAQIPDDSLYMPTNRTDTNSNGQLLAISFPNNHKYQVLNKVPTKEKNSRGFAIRNGIIAGR